MVAANAGSDDNHSAQDPLCSPLAIAFHPAPFPTGPLTGCCIMGLFSFLRRLFFGAPAPRKTAAAAPRQASREPAERRAAASEPSTNGPAATVVEKQSPVRLAPLRYDARSDESDPPRAEEVRQLPYRFARFGVRSGGFLSLTGDGDDALLQSRGLPAFHTPEELAGWAQLPLGKLAWLIHRFSSDSRPPGEKQAHYHFQWRRKRSGGWRLIEAPKPMLRAVQDRILEEILYRIPAHPAAHGFVPGRSIVTNAKEHAGKAVLVHMDLENFYPSVSLARVTAIFRAIGYCREASIWLARLTTSILPQTAAFPENEATAVRPYLRPHLPQGAPTSPALANLSAWSLDVRLSGLSRAYGANYTRYADDLVFSGPEGFGRALRTFLPLAGQVIHAERFRMNKRKRKVIRRHSRQVVTGVVVNEKPNVNRADFDRLKAILTNCIRRGPSTQNRDKKEDFAAHLRGRIAHVQLLNPTRAEKLLALYARIDWKR